jgi:hypothetical protein
VQDAAAVVVQRLGDDSVLPPPFQVPISKQFAGPRTRTVS